LNLGGQCRADGKRAGSGGPSLIDRAEGQASSPEELTEFVHAHGYVNRVVTNGEAQATLGICRRPLREGQAHHIAYDLLGDDVGETRDIDASLVKRGRQPGPKVTR